MRFFKGLILGWITSLMMFLVKRMLAKAFGMSAGDLRHTAQKRAYQPSAGHTARNPYTQRSTANQNHVDVIETLWVGMSVEQLKSAFGMPQSKQTVAGGEVWTYANLNGQGTQTIVSITGGKVASWQDISSRPADPFVAPAP